MKVISLGFRTDLMLRRTAGSVIDDRPDHLVVRTPVNPAFRWGNFVLLGRPPGPEDVRRWAAGFDEEFPGVPYVALGVDGTDGDAGDAAGLAALGLTAEVSTVLTADRLAPPARPLTAEVRRLAGDDDWDRALELRRAMDGPEPPPEHRLFVERRVAETRRLCEAGHGAWFGAFVDGRMRAGAGVFGDGDGAARYQNVETHPGFRGRGLASHVVHRAGQWALSEAGARTLVIVADPGYHAIRIYRALGFADTERQVQLMRLPGERPPGE